MNFETVLTCLQDCIMLGKLMHASGHYQKKNEAALICDCIFAWRWRLCPFFVAQESLVIDGKREWSAFAMAAIAKSYGYSFKKLKYSSDGVRVQMLHNGQPIDEIEFGPTDAQKADLTRKDNYRKWDTRMYYARCLSNLCNDNAQEAFGGAVYTLGELDRDSSDVNIRIPSDPVTPALDLGGIPQAALPAPDAVVATVADATIALYATKSSDEIKQFVDNHGGSLTKEQKDTLRKAYSAAKAAEAKAKEAKAKLREQAAALQSETTEQPTGEDESTTLPTSEMPAPA